MRRVFGKGAGTRLPVGAALVAAGDRIFTSGLLSDHPGGLESEAHRVFQQAVALLRSAGAAPADVVRTRVLYVEEGPSAGSGDAEKTLRSIHGIVFDHPGPAFTAVRVSCLPGGATVELELEAVRGGGQAIRHHQSDEASSTSVAVRWGDEVWLSGMRAIGTDGRVASPGSTSGQVETIMSRTEAALNALGVGAPDVISSRHWMRHDTQADPRPPSWTEFMRQAIPTSAGIAVEGVGPREATFMYEVDAVAGAAKARKNVRTGRTYEVEHHYCRSVRVGQREVVYVAGTTSIIPGEIVRHPDEVAGQVHDTLETVRWGIEQQGLAWSDLVRTRTYIVGGLDKLEEAAAALREAVGGMDAAASLAGVPVLGRPSVRVEIEATAVHG
jgi:enamine deaminase RidA (YjgF/YER057c/UK114 family)